MVIGFGGIQRMAGSVLSTLYEDAVLEIWEMGTERDPATGTFPVIKKSEHRVKVQRDECTEAQRADPGYVAQDVRFLVLQHCLCARPDTDSRIRYRGATYRVMDVAEDPARVYFDARARAA